MLQRADAFDSKAAAIKDSCRRHIRTNGVFVVVRFRGFHYVVPAQRLLDVLRWGAVSVFDSAHGSHGGG